MTEYIVLYVSHDHIRCILSALDYVRDFYGEYGPDAEEVKAIIQRAVSIQERVNG